MLLLCCCQMIEEDEKVYQNHLMWSHSNNHTCQDVRFFTSPIPLDFLQLEDPLEDVLITGN